MTESTGNGTSMTLHSQGTGTGVAQSSGSGSVYDRIDPLVAIEKFGAIYWGTGAGGAKSKADGELLALACISRRMDVFELTETYDLISGKLGMKAVAMLARFRRSGGKHRWLNDGQDGQYAECEFEYEGQKTTVKYTIEDAKRAEMSFKPSSNWVKTPGAMMRARVVSTAIRMLAPELIQGAYCPEELTDGEPDSRPIAAMATEEKPTRKRRTAAEIAADDAAEKAAAKPATAVIGTQIGQVDQSSQMTQSAPQNQVSQQSTLFPPLATPIQNQESQQSDSQEPDSDVIDASFDVAAIEAESTKTQQVQVVETVQTPAVSSQTSPDVATTATLHKISDVCVKLGVTQKDVEDQLRSADPSFKGILFLPEANAQKLLAQLEEMLHDAGK